MDTAAASWEEDLERWLEPFRALLNRPAQKQRMAVYLKGLVLPGERKSLEPPRPSSTAAAAQTD
jgi:hypothetical protein